MAADTAAKRYSAMSMGCAWRGLNVVPAGATSPEQRSTVLCLYWMAGGGEVVAVVSAYIPMFRRRKR